MPHTGKNSIVTINGIIGNTVSVNDRGLNYGDGLFETLVVRRAVGAAEPRAEFYELHLNRLRNGCELLDINFNEDIVKHEITELLRLRRNVDSILKIVITRGESSRGYSYDKNIAATRIISLSNIVSDHRRQRHTGIKTRICDTRVSINPALAGLKHLNRLENVIARAEWSDSTIAEGILLDTEGRLIEGTMSNIFLIENDKIYTADLKRCGVAGIIRKVIIDDIAKEFELPVLVTDIFPEMIETADEIFICNSLIGIWPVSAVGSIRKIIGPITRQLQKCLNDRTA